MAAFQGNAILYAAALVVIFALIGSVAAQEAPSPAPESAAAVPSSASSFAAVCAIGVVSFFFGSALRI